MIVYNASYRLFEIVLNDLKSVIEETNVFCLTEMNKLKEQAKTMSIEEIEFRVMDEFHYYENTFTKINNNMYFVSIVAEFEVFLKRTCNIYAKKHSLPLLSTNGRESLADKVKDFIKSINSPFDFNRKDWAMILAYTKIRNIMIHADADYQALESNEAQIIDKNPAFHIETINYEDINGNQITEKESFYIHDKSFLSTFIMTILHFSKDFQESLATMDV
jgi:hypothetical protein